MSESKIILVDNIISILVVTLCIVVPILVVTYSYLNRINGSEVPDKVKSFLSGSKLGKMKNLKSGLKIPLMFFARSLVLCISIFTLD